MPVSNVPATRQPRMFRGRGGPTDRRLPKQNAARRRPHRDVRQEQEEDGAPTKIPDNNDLMVNEEDINDTVHQELSIEETAQVVNDQQVSQKPTTDEVSGEMMIPEDNSVQARLQKELKHIHQRMSNVQRSFGSVTLYDLPTYQTNVLNAVLNCVAQWRHLVSYYGDEHLTATDARQGGQQLFELVQASLQTGPLSGAKPGYFKRCGRTIATAVHAYLVQIAASEEEATLLHWTDKQVTALQAWTQSALRASESDNVEKAEPSKSVQKQQQKAQSKKQAKQQKRMARKKQLGLANAGGLALMVLCACCQPTNSLMESSVQMDSKSPSALTARSSSGNQPTPLQKTAYEIASSFIPDTSFDPLVDNCHIQTIGGYFMRGTPAAYLPRDQPGIALQKIWQGIKTNRDSTSSSFWDTRERVDTPDDDFFYVDTKNALGNPYAPLVLLLHGLESNSDSDLSQQIATACLEQGFSCACINFRSCAVDANGDLIPNTKIFGYHLGYTDDLMQYLDICRERRPHQKRYVVGFSLGANAALKALGELGQEALERYNIRGGGLLCTPFDQERNALALAQPGINRIVYTNSLLKSLKQKAQEKLDDFCNGDADTTVFDYKRAMDAETITVFDDAFIAPIYNFTDCWDYYQKTSSIHYMEDVAVPTYSINAADDPFFDNTVFPLEKTIGTGGKAPLIMQQAKSGGHLGFCFHQVDANDPRLTNECPSWAPAEVARFLKHVDDHPIQLKKWYF